MFRWEHILIKRLFTSLALLFNLSLLGVSSKIEILFLSDFSEIARSIIWLDVLSEFKSLVLQCNVMWSGSKSQTVGFTWSCMYLTLAELNGRNLRRHVGSVQFSVLVKYHLIFLPCCLKVWKQFLLRLVTTKCY